MVSREPGKIPGGVVHRLPAGLRALLLANPSALETWRHITPLARNEWICWIAAPKKPETRAHHLARAGVELAEGKRRPCCWPGCPHRPRSG